MGLVNGRCFQYEGKRVNELAALAIEPVTADDWELYEPEPEGHDILWIGRQMLDRCPERIRARRKDWPKGDYILLGSTSGVFIYHRDAACVTEAWLPMPNDLTATDWVLAEG